MQTGIQEATTASAMGTGRRMMTVLSKQAIAQDVVLLELASLDELTLPSWEPGAHIDVYLKEDLVRQYSLCGRMDAPTWQIAVLRDPVSRGGSAHIHDEVREGDIIEVGSPRNNFALKAAEEYLFVAGGIGITPILPMLAAATRANKPWKLVYGGRTTGAMAFREMLADSYGDRVDFQPQDTHGILDIDALVSEVSPGARLYTCGPAGMLKALDDRCSQPGSPKLHLERFVPLELPTDDSNSAFTVTLQESNKTLPVEAGQSILEVVEAEGIYVESQCRVGICGTCETRVIKGTPDHRDSLLDEEERAAGETIMICVSRSEDACLVLDL